jgi:N-acetylglucosaminyldiphosphoundecaprenol N-acetyl-beta-D-mannosaminyltransferase
VTWVQGFRIDALTLEEAVARLTAWMDGDRPRVQVSLNAAKLERARRDPGLRRFVAGADLVTADGVGVLAAARLAGEPLPERVPGVDLASRLLEVTDRERRRVWLYGARPEVLAALASRHPSVVGFQHGYLPEAEQGACVRAIRRAAPHLLLVGLGSPAQERFLDAWRADLRVPVAMGVGGSFDVLSGRRRRAPGLVRQAGLEWAWRTLIEPRRLATRQTWDTLAFGLRAVTGDDLPSG